MDIRHIRFDEFGPYRDWSFTPGNQGVQLIYGRNESGKTSLLEGIRAMLFGGKTKNYGYARGFLDVERDGAMYHIGRKGRQIDFYRPKEDRISREPADIWWHGLDKKTYNRVFALTLQDLQGVDVLNEVEVRARFFGAEGGEALGSAVKDVEKNANELLVTSSGGKRRINVLLDELQENRKTLANLADHEAEYVELQQSFYDTERTEEELQNLLRERRDYRDGIDVVLRAWDTYRRGEEARIHMQQYNADNAVNRDEFVRIEDELKRTREYMRTWQEKEAALMPENFSPDSPFAAYGQDIENLIQQGAKWEQLRRECEEGDVYIGKVRQQLEFSRSMYSAWRDDEPMPTDVNWYDGERLSQRLRTAKDQLLHWEDRRPADADDADLSGVSDAAGNVSGESDARRDTLVRELDIIVHDMDRVKAELDEHGAPAGNERIAKWIQRIGGIGAVVGVLLALSGLIAMESVFTTIMGFLLLIASMGLFGYGLWLRHNGHSDVSRLTYELQLLSSRKSDVEHQLEGLTYTPDRKRDSASAAAGVSERRIREGHALRSAYDEALRAWRQWLPAAAAKSLSEEDFFSLKQEYDRYRQQAETIEGYEKRLEEHKESLRAIEDQAVTLWYNLGADTPVSPGELKRLYNQLKSFQQNKIRWEQKEAQRRSFRAEYDMWHRKEKELLLEQRELLDRAGLASSNEYRQHLIDEDQYKQWQTIYKQSRVQLDLLAPDAENRDLFYRRLQEGNKGQWEDELAHADREMAAIEEKLASLYEKRGQIVESMRNLGDDRKQAQALQTREELESELRQVLEDWATQVLIGHCMEQAQQSYEKETQPRMLDIASGYIQRLTDGAYTLDILGIDRGVALADSYGRRLDPIYWSSGLADQVYLALRLALAKVFSDQVEPLPIILDDILVRFDADRAERALSLLAEIARGQQIFVLTCQKSIRDMATGIANIDVHSLNGTSARTVV